MLDVGVMLPTVMELHEGEKEEEGDELAVEVFSFLREEPGEKEGVVAVLRARRGRVVLVVVVVVVLAVMW